MRPSLASMLDMTELCLVQLTCCGNIASELNTGELAGDRAGRLGWHVGSDVSSGGVVPATSQLRPRPLCPRLGWAGLGWAGLGWADKIVPAQHTQSPAARCQHTTGHTARPGRGMEPRSV